MITWLTGVNENMPASRLHSYSTLAYAVFCYKSDTTEKLSILQAVVLVQRLCRVLL
jgi:hypothetical protein